MHQLQKAQKENLPEDKVKQPKGDDLEASEDNDNDAEKDGKKGKKIHINKNTLSDVKMANKRAQKEAIKKVKESRSKGTHVNAPTPGQAGNADSDSGDSEAEMAD